MKKIFLLFIISGWLTINLFAATKIDHQAIVQQIFNQLTATVGDYSATLPQVVIRPQKRFGASYRRSENTIFIEQAALDICASFGAESESAIAFLLGHELTHYYQKHDWQEPGFTTGFLTSEKVFQENIHHEKEADTYSAFVTHLAGYNSAKILPQLLEKIYIAYELKGKQMTAYPPLEERQALANEVCKTVQGLIDIYQAGNYLYALGKYEEAMVSYEYLLKYVKYKELYNNIGLCALNAVIPNMNRANPFVYPLMLDTNIPLRAPSGFTNEELIQKAIQNFTLATNYDNSYFPSYLHLICAYDLNGQYQETVPLLNSIRKLATQPKFKQQLILIEGISAFRKKEKEQANISFSKVKNNKDYPDLATIGSLNLQILKGEKVGRTTNPPLTMLEDKIEDISLLFFEKTDKAATYVLRDTPLDKKEITVQNILHSKIYLYNSNGRITKMQLTKSEDMQSKRGIRIGITFGQIKEVYASEDYRTVPHLHGFYLIVPYKGLFFNFNEMKTVVEWGVFID